MEKIYAPDNLLATEPYEVAKYFQEYSQICPLEHTTKEDVLERRKFLLKEEFGLELDHDNEDILLMEEMCSVDKLRARQEIKELPLLKAPANHVMPHYYKINKDAQTLETVKCKQRFNAIQKDLFFGLVVKIPKYVEEKNKDETLVEDIIPGSTFMYKVVVHKPFNTMTEKRLTIESILTMFEFEVLGTNTLTQLCDKIKCVSDKFIFKPVENIKVDLEELMNPIEKRPARCFFIENTFYNDTRHLNATDYSEVVIEWAKRNNIGDFEKKTMDVRIDTLIPRLGFGYVYIHQGKCEHIITFSDARLVQSSDCLIYSEYPRSLLYKVKANYMCFICRHSQATWMVAESDRLPVSKAFFCTKCCESYMFLDGKKLGEFKLYPYYHEDTEVEKIDCVIDSDEEILGHEDSF